MKKFPCILLTLALLLCGCGQTEKEQTAATEGSLETTGAAVPEETVHYQSAEDTSQLFTDRDYKTSYDKHATITLEGTTAQCDSDAVRIEGSTITVLDEGTYVFSGSWQGQILVDADKSDKTQLVLSGVEITCQDSAPLYIRQADKVFVTLESENTLTGGESFTPDGDTNIDGVIFSKEDLTLNGEGRLTIASPAGHGIVSKDELTVTGGNYQITTASHGIAGKDNVCIDGGSFTIAAGKDGIHAENNDDAALGFVYIKNGSFTVSAEGDGISAAAWMQLDGGDYDLTTGGGSKNGTKKTSDNWGGFGGGMGPGGRPQGGRPQGGGNPWQQGSQNTDETESTSIKGFKAGGELVVNGGSYKLDTADDGVHSNQNLTINGGNFAIATGDDGFHADETLTVNAGEISVTESYEGLEGLHIRVVGGEISLVARDDGLNAAGGADQSGMGGRDPFGGGGWGGGFGGGPGGMSSGNGSIVISGGNLAVQASGDGIDANGTLEITGGYTTVCGPTQGDTATLDYDKTGTITGGTFIGSGGTMMAQSFSDSSQGVIAVRASAQAGNNQIRLTDAEGKELLCHTPALGYDVVILSTPEMVKGQTYTLQIGTMTNQVTAN